MCRRVVWSCCACCIQIRPVYSVIDGETRGIAWSGRGRHIVGVVVGMSPWVLPPLEVHLVTSATGLVPRGICEQSAKWGLVVLSRLCGETVKVGPV